MKKTLSILIVLMTLVLVLCVGCKKPTDNGLYVTYSGAPMNTPSGISNDPFKVEMTEGTSYTIVAPATTLQNGKKFLGWKTSDQTIFSAGQVVTMGNKSVTYTAVWATAYSLTFVGGDNTQGTAPDVLYYAEGEIAELPDCTFTKIDGGWRFDYWASSVDNDKYRENSSFVVGNTNVTFTAQWTQSYRIIFESGGIGSQTATGKAPYIASRAEGESFSLPENTYTLAGYDFDGWLCNIDNEKYAAGDTYQIGSSDTTFTAQWKVAATASEGNFSFTQNDDGYTIAKKSDVRFSGNLVLPQSFNNLPITQIAADGFKNCGFSSVTIPATITKIGSNAFSACAALTTVLLASDNALTDIGEYAFANCQKLTSFGEEGQSANSLNLPASIVAVPDFAFFNCGFSNIIIGETIETVGNAAFAKNKSLKTFSVSAENKNFANSTNMLTSKDGTTIYCYAVGLTARTIELGAAETVKQYAFSSSVLTQVNIGETLKKIEKNAFEYCTALVKLYIEDSKNNIEEVGESAFLGCTSMVEFYVGKNLTVLPVSALRGCPNIGEIICHSQNTVFSSISNTLYSKDGKTLIFHAPKATGFTLPNSVETIGSYAFESNSITEFSVSAESALTSIQDYAFYDCVKLAVLNLGDKLTTIGQNAFYNCKVLTGVSFGEKLASIGQYAFYGCSALTTVTFNRNCPLSQISAFAFAESGLTNMSLPNNVQTIFNNAFSGCVSLKLVSLNNVREIKYEAFSGSGIEKITITKSVEVLSDRAFAKCQYLASFEVHAENAYFSNYTYQNGQSTVSDGNLYNKGLTVLLAVPRANANTETFVLASFVREIGNYAFYGCAEMTTFATEENSVLTSINAHAFERCTRLISVALPASVTFIGDYAFYDCGILKTLTYEGDIQSINIGENAFGNCAQLQSDLKTLSSPSGNIVATTAEVVFSKQRFC